MDIWTSNEESGQTSYDWVEPEMAAMRQADIVWEEMEWDKMERQEMEAVKVQVPAEGGTPGGRPQCPPCRVIPKARCAGPPYTGC